jgi:hypothetical protein
MNMPNILALADLSGARSAMGPEPEEPRSGPEELGAHMDEAAARLDALVGFLDAICREWATTPETDRVAAAGLAAEIARKVRALVAAIAEHDGR